MDEKMSSSGTTDLTTGRPLWRILVFALPLVLGTVFQQLYSFADTVIVGRCLGTDALAAVGSTYSLNFLILGFIQGACVGFGIPVAEAFGAKNRGDLHRYLANGAWLCVAVSVVFTILTTLLAAPLLIGCDMAQMDDFTRSLLTNDEVIDVNQDPLGLQAVPVWQQGDQVIYAKHLEDGSMAVGLFNRGWQTVKMNFTLRMLGLRGRQTVRDLWRQKDLTECTDKFETAVAPHGVVLVRVYPGNSREQATGK